MTNNDRSAHRLSGRRRGRRVVATLAAAGMVMLAACGSDDESSTPATEAPATDTPATTAAGVASTTPASTADPTPASTADTPATDTGGATSGVELSAQRIEERLAIPSEGFVAPGPPIAGDVSSLDGKEVWFVPINMAAIPFFQTFRDGMEDAFQNVGISVRTCDGAGTPGTIGSCIDDAASQKAGAVVTGSVSSALAERAFENARSAGVPILVTNQGYPEPSTTEQAYLSFDTNELLRLAADWVIADSGGEATVLITRIADSEWTADAIDNGAVPQFEQNCPDCKLEIVDINFASVDQMAPAVAAAFSRNPDIDYVMPQYTSVVPMVLEGVRNAGFEDKVRGVSATGVLDGVQRVADGDFIYAEIGINIYQQGWMAADQVIRMMLGEEPLQELDVPFRVFTDENVGELELTPEAFHAGTWYGDTGFREVYLDLWGIG